MMQTFQKDKAPKLLLSHVTLAACRAVFCLALGALMLTFPAGAYCQMWSSSTYFSQVSVPLEEFENAYGPLEGFPEDLYYGVMSAVGELFRQCSTKNIKYKEVRLEGGGMLLPNFQNMKNVQEFYRSVDGAGTDFIMKFCDENKINYLIIWQKPRIKDGHEVTLRMGIYDPRPQIINPRMIKVSAADPVQIEKEILSALSETVLSDECR